MLLAALLLFFLGNRGDASQVQRIIGESQVYTEEEIAQAMDEVEDYFQRNFEGCKLLTLQFDDNWWRQREAWEEYDGVNQVMVLRSSFYVEPNGGDGSLSQDWTYNDWQWILTRSNGGNWVRIGHGYG